LFYFYHFSGKCSDTCSSLQASILKSYLTANSRHATVNTDLSNVSSTSTTASVTIGTIRQLICSMDNTNTTTSFDTTINNENVDQNMESHRNFTVNYTGLGSSHPFKTHANQLFDLFLSVLSPINMKSALEILEERERNAKSVYPDAASLDRSLTLAQIAGKYGVRVGVCWGGGGVSVCGRVCVCV
jgi:hypothetical protein